MSVLSVSTNSSIIHRGPQCCFQEVTAAVSELREHLHTILMEDWTKVFGNLERVKVLQPPEPTSRAGFLQYSQKITLDPNTANEWIRLSKENRKATRMEEDQHHPHHPDRFTGWCVQVLSRESLTGRCNWELELIYWLDSLVTMSHLCIQAAASLRHPNQLL
ncbi:tripartite motif-containing protein 16-like [Gouania willdenowi]|uniref:tripartite motif-containing protein 16-like n=1 Tax=Gouania willdenowi TaxID=441366 RepID=UPI0010549ACA|nr:tripartite motif-containing protein 16-like [Gouania willdenowi]